MTSSEGLTYRDAGVDIDAGGRLVDRIKPIAQRTTRPGVMGGLGGFGALFEIPLDRYKRPVLVSGTDGVGTKLRLAIDLGKHRSVGIDLVAMCVNDLLVQGAEPLFFLDYYATGKLDVEVAADVIEGIGKGCELAGAALIGGETAEMPGMYQAGDYDLAGFAVGIVEKDQIIDGSKVAVGDAVIGIASSGPHSNGYSLIRKIIEVSHANLDDMLGQRSLGDLLLEPTRIYAKTILTMLTRVDIHALAHITGGGLLENIPRVMPAYTQAVIDTNAWTRPAIFDWLQKTGNVAINEMHRTFNCGIGMVMIVNSAVAQLSVAALLGLGEQAWQIGTIEKSGDEEPSVTIG